MLSHLSFCPRLWELISIHPMKRGNMRATKMVLLMFVTSSVMITMEESWRHTLNFLLQSWNQRWFVRLSLGMKQPVCLDGVVPAILQNTNRARNASLIIGAAPEHLGSVLHATEE